MLNECAVCGKSSTNQCSRCKKVYYCSVAHQREHHVEHRNECIEPFSEFLLDEMFNSYYDGALVVYVHALTFEFEKKKVSEMFARFLQHRMEAVQTKGNCAAELVASEQLTMHKMAENRARALVDAEKFLGGDLELSAEQKQHVMPVLEKHREKLSDDKSMGFVCGYMHAVLEVMQRLMKPDFSNSETASKLGAAALATCSIALQAALERLRKFKEAAKS